MRLSPPVLGVVFGGLTLAACGGGGGKVRLELVRVPAGGGAAAPTAAFRSARAGIPWTSNVSISSLKTPVTLIEIVGPDGRGKTLYQCPGATADDCLVELNGPALSSLLSSEPVSVPPGSYDQVTVGYCVGGGSGYRSYLTGEGDIGGVRYHTTPTGNLSSTGVPGPVPVVFGAGCGDAYPIAPPLVVADTFSIPVVLRLYFDIRDIAYMALGDPATAPLAEFSCSPVATPSTDPFVCSAYTSVAALPGTLPPVVERYRINGAATVGLMFEPGTDRFIAGYFRRFVTEDVAWNPGFTPDSFAESFTANGDGTYRLHQVQGANFPRFQRATHSGVATMDDGRPLPYSAVRLP